MMIALGTRTLILAVPILAILASPGSAKPYTPGDDIVDITLRVGMGVLCTLNIGGCTPAQAPAGALRYTDGAFISSAFFANEFPYLRAPLPGSPNNNNAINAAGSAQ